MEDTIMAATAATAGTGVADIMAVAAVADIMAVAAVADIMAVAAVVGIMAADMGGTIETDQDPFHLSS